jgi:glycosyltransferase involved in cell wall biosynthesis
MLLSIITIVKNDVNGLKKTIDSISKQKVKNFEYIVIDGASLDGTVELINKNSSVISKSTSKPDTGISDAFNSGIRIATGKYILMLNAGDFFISDSATEVIETKAGIGDDILCFGVLNEKTGIALPTLSSHPGVIHHQGLVVGKSIHKKHGNYSECFRLRMDYEFLLRCKKDNVNFKFINAVISSYQYGGLSTHLKNRLKFYQEGIAAEILNQGYPQFDTLARYIFWYLRSL